MTRYRPKLLTSAALHFARHYNLNLNLPIQLRTLDYFSILLRLDEQEISLNAQRQAQDPAYRFADHVKILGCLLAEAARPNADGSGIAPRSRGAA